MRRRLWLLVPTLAIGVLLADAWRGRARPEPSLDRPASRAGRTGEALAPGERPAAAPGELLAHAGAARVRASRLADRAPPPGPDGAAAEFDLVAHLNRYPPSATPHAVLRAWGGPPGDAEIVGVVAVVDPRLSTRELEALAGDLRDAYRDADTFSALVYDSEEAATYDRHVDGGALAARHLVAEVRIDAALEVDSVRIRGVSVEP